MKYLSLCSGIEAATVAWHPMGWRPVGFSEIEPFPCSVLAHHYPDTPNLGDMTLYHEWPDSLRPDLVVAGTPCQAFSVAGLRKGLADPRGNLTLVFLGVLERYRPRWVVWENVPGVLSDRTGAFGALLGGLGELGYGFAYRVLDAQYYGVAQRRRRVFVVGCLGDWRAAAAVLFEPESLRGDPPPRRRQGEGTAPTLAARSRGGGGLGTDAECDGALVPEVAHALKAHRFDGSEDGTGRGTPLVPEVAGCLQERDTKGADSDTKPGHLIPVATFQQSSMKGKGTIGYDASGLAKPCKTQEDGQMIHSGLSVRRLTPRECERLQGFPDDYTLIPHRGKPAADGPRYKALGNSMAVPVMRWIGEGIEAISKRRI